jgi:hypothetical protein
MVFRCNARAIFLVEEKERESNRKKRRGEAYLATATEPAH